MTVTKVARDTLGDRMKGQYEDRTRYCLPRRTYSILRLDGKAFHSLTQHLERPYDWQFLKIMDGTAWNLCKNVQGAKFAFVQSDEISLLLTDFETTETAAWFDGNIQKIVSVAASIATDTFNQNIPDLSKMRGPAWFDARVFTIADIYEVENYFIWRQKDAERNSVQMLAQSLISHKDLVGVNMAAQHDLIHQHGDNWNNHPDSFKRGRCVVRDAIGWTVDLHIPIFTQDREYLRSRIPRLP